MALTATPDLHSEPVPGVAHDSLDRLVDGAHRAVCKDTIDPFDQLQIDTFQSIGRLFSRPLLVKLRKGEYRTYVNLWKGLLCFAYGSTCPDQLQCSLPLLDPKNSRIFGTSYNRLHVILQQVILLRTRRVC